MIIDEIKKERMTALKRKNRFKMQKLSNVLAECDRKQLYDDVTITKILTALIDSVRVTMNSLDAGSLKMQESVAEINVYSEFLPSYIMGTDLQVLVESISKKLNASSMRDFGAVKQQLAATAAEQGKAIDYGDASKFYKQFIG